MRYDGVADFLGKAKAVLAKGPVAIIIAEDAVELDGTLRHHLDLGFPTVLVLASPDLELLPELEAKIHRIASEKYGIAAVASRINRITAAAPGTWFYYCYNAEYLFFPFCETRNIRELLTFQTEERRDAILTYVVDLYAGDLTAHPDAVSTEDAMLDRSGYYALGRLDPERNVPHERQLDFFGGLRWRFEEHIPLERRKIDRIGLFRAKPGLTLRLNHTFSDEEYNTYACPWHNNITATIVSFRTAKALRSNPGSKFDIHNFQWRNSTPFKWHSQQLMDLGLMEPGQWF
jgi:hypothetical protein